MGAQQELLEILVELRGALKTITELQGTSAALRETGAAADQASVGMRNLQHRSFLANQALFTMRRYLYQATLATTALGIASAFIGIKYNAMVQRATIALRYLGNGAFVAGDELNTLLDIARNTAFLPSNIVNAGQQLIAFGFTAQTTNRILRDTGDAIAALNLPQETVNRIILALGQISVKGRVMGEELRQLANANIPAYQYLADAFGKNVVQIGKIADAGIPAAAGIEAILRGLERQYGGASAAIVKTTSGQWEQLRGDIQVILGGIFKTGFDRLATSMQKVTKVTGEMQHALRYNNATFSDLVDIADKATGGAFHLHVVIQTLINSFRATWRTVGLILTVLKPFVILLLAALYAASTLANAFLDLVNKGGKPLIWALRILFFYMLLDTAILKLNTLWTNRAVTAKKFMVFWSNRQKAVTIVLTAVTTVYTAASVAATNATIDLGIALGTTFGVAAGIMVGIVIVILAVIASLIILELKFHAVSRAVVWLWEKLKALWNWLRSHNLQGALLSMIPVVGPTIGFASTIAGFFQHGGTAGRAGRYVVGERGAEIVDLPAGAKVKPVTAHSMDWSGVSAAGGIGNITIYPAPVYVDGREIAEVVFKHRADRIARA